MQHITEGYPGWEEQYNIAFMKVWNKFNVLKVVLHFTKQNYKMG